MAPLAQQSGPIGIAQRRPAEVRAVDVADAIEPRKALVQVRVVGRQQLRERTVVAHLALDEQLRLPLERRAQVVVELGVGAGVRIDGPQVADVEPLAAEVPGQGRRPRIGQHALHLGLEHPRLPERAAGRDVEQLVVRDRAPQEERQPRGELQVADRVDAVRREIRRIALDAEQELRRDEQARQRFLNPPLEAALVVPGTVEPEQRVHVRIGDRPAIGPPGEGSQDFLRARLFVGRAIGPADPRCGAGSPCLRARSNRKALRAARSRCPSAARCRWSWCAAAAAAPAPAPRSTRSS